MTDRIRMQSREIAMMSEETFPKNDMMNIGTQETSTTRGGNRRTARDLRREETHHLEMRMMSD